MTLHFWFGKLSDQIVMPLSTGRTDRRVRVTGEVSSDLVVLNLRCLWGVRSCIRLWRSGGGSSLEIETCRWEAFGVAVVSGMTPRVFCFLVGHKEPRDRA